MCMAALLITKIWEKFKKKKQILVHLNDEILNYH